MECRGHNNKMNMVSLYIKLPKVIIQCVVQRIVLHIANLELTPTLAEVMSAKKKKSYKTKSADS